MGSLRKSFSLFLVLTLAFSSLLAVASIPVGKAQSGTNVTGIIHSDTTWTQADSPHTLTGNVLVNNGVTLTIQAGTIVNLNGYYIEVNGTLHALGTTTNQIYFNNGSTVYGNLIFSVTFTQFSSSWNEQSGRGSIIENAVLNPASILIDGTSPKIDSNNINGIIRVTDSENTTILDNKIFGGIEDGSTVSTIISDNTISVSTAFQQANGFPVSYGIFSRNHNNIAIINNTISGFPVGMDIGYTEGVVSDNTISDCINGIETSGNSSPQILRNLITGSNQYGLMIQTADTVAENNTITNCTIGITLGLFNVPFHGPINHYLFGAQPSIVNNNIYGNSQYNFYSKAEDNVTFIDNWWGTTNTQAINQTIYDFQNDFNLGTVNFVPFLTAPNPQALPNLNAPILTPTPTVLEFPSIVILLFLTVIVSTSLLVYLKKHKR
jgi:hypothetical protein